MFESLGYFIGCCKNYLFCKCLLVFEKFKVCKVLLICLENVVGFWSVDEVDELLFDLFKFFSLVLFSEDFGFV